MSIPGGGEWLIILLVLLLLFGAQRLPKLARSLGEAGKELKKGMKEGAQEQPIDGPCPFCGVQIPPGAKFCPGCAKSADDILAEKERKTA
ncbi:MAG TPA: twin-arginine translocase TatA/TatE family subunit [Actinomycetota bacterium]|jgi:sec-independent protein translocase protein TatA|nr:twin-arginine translocase TatA/TatE family subunit [Actinomycetota bacterium]